MCDFLLKLLRAGSMVGTDAALLQELESRAVHTSPSQLSRPGYGRLTSRRSRPRRACQRPMSLTRRRFQPQPPSLPNIYVASTSILEVEAIDKHYQQQKQDVSSQKQWKKIWIHIGMSRQSSIPALHNCIALCRVEFIDNLESTLIGGALTS
ncbi:hypothetical protein OsJ_04663 [Oryza sativa Japonica Group]|uniref:Uncharacterized protein n=1 Tax=Oryza sativa subsp. japonica TaxID=39947 RepID=A3A190_ORYSJ|nr:hypothetical protein OsJ_04663 [Oryza sativa Japonica Group]